MSVVYDAGVFIAAERNDRSIWADHRTRLELGLVPHTTAPVVAQVSRDARQTQLHRMLRGCQIAAFRPEQAHAVGRLLADTATSDVVDAQLVVTAAERSAAVLTSDPDDIRRLARQLPRPVTVRQV